jgi:carbon storage regulator
MLILTRRPAETIYIGEQVTVTVLGVVGNQVRFGIEAPRSITIDRAEIYERKKRAAQEGGPGSTRDAGPSNGSGNGAPDGNVADHRVGDDDDEVNGNVADAPMAQTAATAMSQAKARR